MAGHIYQVGGVTIKRKINETLAAIVLRVPSRQLTSIAVDRQTLVYLQTVINETLADWSESEKPETPEHLVTGRVEPWMAPEPDEDDVR